MTEAEELEYLRLKKRKAIAMQAQPAAEAPPVTMLPDESMSRRDRANYYRSQGPEMQQPKMDRMQSVATGVLDMASSLPVIGRAVTAPAEALQPGFDGKAEIKQQMNQSLQDNPLSTRVGQGAALAGGGGASLWVKGEQAMAKAAAPISKALGVTSASAADKGIRYGSRLIGLGGLGVTENAAFNTLAEGRNQSNLTGEDVNGLELAKKDLLNPYAVAAAPALSGIFRVGKYARSGGQTFTPDAVAARVNAALTPGRAQILNAEQFGVIDPQAEKLLFRLLIDSGHTRDDIVTAVNAFEQSIKGGEDLAMLPSRLKDVLVDKLGDGAKEAVDGFLQGAANRTGTQGAASVGAGVAEDAGRLSQFVKDSAEGRFGSGSRFNTLEGAEQELSTIGQQYETLFSPGAVAASPQDEQALKQVVDFYSNDREISKYVAAQASKMQMSPQAYIEQNPRRAAHLMQQVAREIVDENPSPTIVNAYSGIRDNLLRPLEASTPGYRQTRQEFGDEYGFKKALTFAGRFFTKAEDDIAVGQLAKEYAEMTPRQQDAAKLAMRDEALKVAMRRTEGGAPRLSILEREGSLAAMERVFGQEGAEFANDIRATAERLKRNQRISSGTGSNTMNKQQASEFAESAVSNKFVRGVGNALQNLGGDAAISGVTGFMSPVMTGRAAIRGMGNALAQGRQGKIDKLSGLLMKDAGARPRAPMSGDGPVPTPTAAAPEAISQGVTQSPPVPSRSPVSSAGLHAFRADAGNALSGAYAGSILGSVDGMNNDINGDGVIDSKDARAGALRGMAIGAVGIPAYARGSNALATRAYSRRVPAEVKTLAEQLHNASGTRGGAFKDAPATYRTRLEAEAAKRLGVEIPEPPLAQGMGGGKPPKIKSNIPDHGYDDIRIGSASVEVTRVGDKMTINRVKVPEEARGQGDASKALKEVLRQADEQGLTVFLTADPVGTGGLSKPQLKAFYGRNGFVANSGKNKDFSEMAGMIRRPKAPVRGAGFTGGKRPKIKSDVPLGTRPRARQPLPDVTGDTVEPNRRLVKVMSEPAPQAAPRGKGEFNQKPLYTVRRQPTDTPGDLQKGDRFPAEGLKKKQNPILAGQGDGDRQWVLLSDSASGAKKAFDRGQGMRKKNGNVQDVLYRGQAKTINVPDTIFGNGKRMRDLVQSAFDDGSNVVKLVFRNGREVYVAKDASVLRSPRAGFDPAKSGSKDIMAALPLVGGAGAVAMHDGKTGNSLATPPRDQKTGRFTEQPRNALSGQ